MIASILGVCAVPLLAVAMYYSPWSIHLTQNSTGCGHSWRFFGGLVWEARCFNMQGEWISDYVHEI
jgi:hypothetical protein